MTDLGVRPLDVNDRQQKEKVRTHFDGSESWQGMIYADQADRFNKAVARRKRNGIQMLRRAGSLKGKNVLDIGCGCGAYLEELAMMGMEPYGMDLSPQMVHVTRGVLSVKDQFSEEHVRTGDIEAIPFSSSMFDVVVCVGVFGYLLTDDVALQEVHRVLRTGGLFLVSVQNSISLSNIDYILRMKLRRVFTKRDDASDADPDGVFMTIPWVSEHSPTHHAYKCYNPWKWERVIAAHGFRKMDSMTCGQELRILRRTKLIPETLLTSAEVVTDWFLRRVPVPFLSRAGESHIGLFQKTMDTGGTNKP